MLESPHMIEVYADQRILSTPSKNKEGISQEHELYPGAVLKFSGIHIPKKLEDIPHEVFGKEEDEFALLSVSEGVATFVNVAMDVFMYAYPGEDIKDPTVYVVFPFSVPGIPHDIYLDVDYIESKLETYAANITPDQPFFTHSIAGFDSLKRSVEEAERKAKKIKPGVINQEITFL